MPTTSSRGSGITRHTLVKALHANVEHARTGFNSIYKCIHCICVSYILFYLLDLVQACLLIMAGVTGKGDDTGARVLQGSVLSGHVKEAGHFGS